MQAQAIQEVSEMGKIKIYFGIYEFRCSTPFHFEGFNHVETREVMPMANKLKHYLLLKGMKFHEKYGVNQFAFTLGTDADNHIEVIAITHPVRDKFKPEIGEDVVIGRIKRMRGDVKKDFFKYDENGELIDRKLVYYKPYDLNEHVYGNNNHDYGLKYPYIYKMGWLNDEQDGS